MPDPTNDPHAPPRRRNTLRQLRDAEKGNGETVEPESKPKEKDNEAES